MRFHQSTRFKTLSVLLAIFSVLGLVIYILLRSVLLPSFDAYEAQAVEADVERVLAALRDEAWNMDRDAYDWSVWDDAYRFALDGNEAFRSSNLVDTIYNGLDVDAIAYLGLDGRVLWEAWFAPGTHAREKIPSDVRGTLLGGPLLGDARSREIRRGLIQTAKGPMLVVSSPILKSDGQGPARGTLILGRVYDEGRQEQLGKLTQLRVSLVLRDSAEFSRLKGLFPPGTEADRPLVLPVDEKVVHGVAPVRDIFGEEQFFLRVEEDREIHRKGLAVEKFLMGSLAAMVAGCALALFFGLDRLVVRPIVRLSDEVGRIGAGQDLSARVGREGEDEIAHLSREIDGMLVSLGKYQQDLRDAYEELCRTQEAAKREDRLRAMGEMASGIAHDINNALVPIIALADLLSQDESIDERARSQTGMILRAGQGIGATVARLRRFYRERPDDELIAPVDINKVAMEAAELTRPRWRDIPHQSGKVVELLLDLGEAVQPVRGSEHELREAVTNLLINAVDAMPDGGVLRLRTSSSGGSPSRVSVEVTDTGVGMDEEMRSRCLEPFYTTKGTRGTGLGLAIVYGVVKRMGGEIAIESAPGKGTTFCLSFDEATPGPDIALREESPGSEAPAGVAPLRILCVDDEPVVRVMVQTLLEAQGHRVHSASGGAEALAAFDAFTGRNEAFDVVITDLGMPHMDGRQVAAAVKARSPGTPVILLTGWGPMLGDGSVPEPHIDLILSKPVTIRSFREALAKVVMH